MVNHVPPASLTFMPFYLSLHSSYLCSSTILSSIMHQQTIHYLSIHLLSVGEEEESATKCFYPFLFPFCWLLSEPSRHSCFYSSQLSLCSVLVSQSTRHVLTLHYKNFRKTSACLPSSSPNLPTVHAPKMQLSFLSPEDQLDLKTVFAAELVAGENSIDGIHSRWVWIRLE